MVGGVPKAGTEVITIVANGPAFPIIGMKRSVIRSMKTAGKQLFE
jgi:hypothetical protein